MILLYTSSPHAGRGWDIVANPAHADVTARRERKYVHMLRRTDELTVARS